MFLRNKCDGPWRSVKDLVDEHAVHAIIVLSDDSAAFSLPSDSSRQEFVWVPYFSMAEAHAYLDKRGFLVPANKCLEWCAWLREGDVWVSGVVRVLPVRDADLCVCVCVAQD